MFLKCDRSSCPFTYRYPGQRLYLMIFFIKYLGIIYISYISRIKVNMYKYDLWYNMRNFR